MGRKVFLSFLGTGDYEVCNYYLESDPTQKVEDVKYIQEAIIKLKCKNFTEDDTVLFFLTKQAKEMNFLDDGQWNRSTKNYDKKNVGLQTRLNLLNQNGISFQILTEDIPDGFSEEEVWQIFEKVADKVDEYDEVFFDVTHGFRLLPMVGIVLMNYLKTTKNIKVMGIYYGGFEKLGRQADVMEMKKRGKEANAPILDLSTLLEFQEWTSATREFLSFGEVESLAKLSLPKIGKIIRDSDSKDKVTIELNKSTKFLKNLIENIKSNRLKEIFKTNLDEYDELVSSLANKHFEIKPFNQIIGLIKAKTHELNVDFEIKWLATAKWCFSHGLLMQSFSQLEEGLKTYLMLKLQNQLPKINLEIYSADDRTFFGSVLKIYSDNILREKWKFPKDNSSKYFDYADLILDSSFFQIDFLIKIYIEISDYRNDLMHGGMRENSSSSSKIKSKISKYLKDIEIVLGGNNINSKKTQIDNLVFLNLSNHPSTTWPKAQTQAAIQQYGRILDIPFPVIDPLLDESGIQSLAQVYLEKIIAINPSAVHLMGELTFTFELVQLLKNLGITAIASTTHRITVDLPDGTKQVKFEFVRFRDY